jgi:hypothetical protein
METPGSSAGALIVIANAGVDHPPATDVFAVGWGDTVMSFDGRAIIELFAIARDHALMGA